MRRFNRLFKNSRTFRCVAAIPLTLLWNFESQAADVDSQWLGTTDQLWGTSSNWDPATTPNNGADTFDVTFPASLASPVLANGSFSVRSVSIGAATALEIDNARTLTITGFINNDGIIAPQSTSSNTTLSISGAVANTVTLGGNGAVILDAPSDRMLGATNHLLVQESGHTIRGAGTLGANLINFVNRGTITGDNPAGILVVDPRNSLSNDGGTLSALSGGTLRLGAGDYSSTNDGLFLVGDGSTIELSGASVESSPFNVDDQDNDLSNNQFVVATNSSVSGVTNSAAISVGNARTLTVGVDGLTNNGGDHLGDHRIHNFVVDLRWGR